MRRTFLLKSAIVVASIAAGVLLGRAVVSQAGQPKPRPRPQAGPVQKRFSGSGETNPIVLVGYEKGKRYTSPKPGVFVVNAEARITNFMETQRFRWLLRIGPSNDTSTLLREIAYDDQRIVIRHGETITPTFREEVPLPPGRYIASLHLQSEIDFPGHEGDKLPLASTVFYQTVE